MSHKFRFTKDSMERLKTFAIPEEQETDKKSAKALARPEKPRRDKQEQPAASAEPQAAQPAAACNVQAACRTHIGKVRRSNQDALIESAADGLWGVADGMGGHNGGETASAGARDGVLELLSGKKPEQSALRTAIGAVNRRLYLRQLEDESLSGMGTTLTLLWFAGDAVHIGHVGDSRAYRLRDGKLAQITDDHSVVAELVRSGVLTPEQAASHPMRNVITRAVGTEEGVEIDLLCEERRAGDVWLVCSDGLYGMVGDDAITGALTSLPIDQAADRLLAAALEAGGRDNTSLVILLDKEGAQ